VRSLITDVTSLGLKEQQQALAGPIFETCGLFATVSDP
jgi:hypothetical protein